MNYSQKRDGGYSVTNSGLVMLALCSFLLELFESVRSSLLRASGDFWVSQKRFKLPQASVIMLSSLKNCLLVCKTDSTD